MGIYPNILSRIFQSFILVFFYFGGFPETHEIPPGSLAGILPGILLKILPEIYPRIYQEIPPWKILPSSISSKIHTGIISEFL